MTTDTEWMNECKMQDIHRTSIKYYSLLYSV